MNKVVRPMEIYIANVPFDSNIGSKRRPALVVDIYERYVMVFKITSKYESKSSSIKKTYYPIKNWKEAGLIMKSYVDIHKNYKITREATFSRPPIGKLEVNDVDDLYVFIHNFIKNSKGQKSNSKN